MSTFHFFFLEVQSMWITFSIKFQCPELLMRSSLCPDIGKQHWLPNWHLEIQDKNLLCGWVTLDSSYAKPGVGLDEFVHSFIRYLWSAHHVPSSNSWGRNVKKAITAPWMIYLSVSPRANLLWGYLLAYLCSAILIWTRYFPIIYFSIFFKKSAL